MRPFPPCNLRTNLTPLAERARSGGLVLRGITARPPVGLLSELEALRYIEVGSRLKGPASPLWVVASQTHYSLL